MRISMLYANMHILTIVNNPLQIHLIISNLVLTICQFGWGKVRKKL